MKTGSEKPPLRGFKTWEAELRLHYRKVGEKTVPGKRSHRGPLLVQKPFHPEGPGVCHTYIVHPPGGVAGGDRLTVRVNVDSGAHALLTTPASGKFYRSGGQWSVQNVRIDIGKNAACEWLPQDSIFHDGARARLKTAVNLAPEAVFMGWEVTTLGLGASRKPFQTGEIFTGLEISAEGIPLLAEPTHILAPGPVLDAQWALNGHAVFGTFLCVPCPEILAEKVKRLEEKQNPEALFAATLLGEGVLVCRFLGNHAYMAMEKFLMAWRIVRPAVVGKNPCPPRIWST